MFYTGGLGLDTEMLSFLRRKDKKTGKDSIKVRLGDALEVNDNGGLLVSIGRLEEKYYMSRFWPLSSILKSRSNHNLKLSFSDGSTVVCDRLQKFMMGNRKWKEANKLIPEDTFFQVCRHPELTECLGDFRDDKKKFLMLYTEGVKPIKFVKAEELPNKSLDLGIAVDFIRDNVILGNGLMAEGLCLNIKEHDTDWY